MPIIIKTMSLAEAAEALNVARSTIYRAVEDGDIREVECGGKVRRVLAEDVENWQRDSRGRKSKIEEMCDRREENEQRALPNDGVIVG